MGNDGGSIPKRHELVKDAARAPTLSELKATALESLAHSWAHCALSGNPIDLDSVVSDWRGRLYSYEPVLKGLMPSTSDSAAEEEDEDARQLAAMGVRSLRDVARLKFMKNGDKWICPISMKEMGPGTKAVYIVPCCHVFAELAMREIEEKSCPECGEAFQQDNVVVILPTVEKEVERLEKRIEALRTEGLTHTLKKDKSDKKKKKQKKRKGGDGDEALEETDQPEAKKKKSRSGNDVDARISGINNPLAASLAAKVLAEQGELNKRRKMVAEAIQSR